MQQDVRIPLIIANWKMNKTTGEAAAFVTDLQTQLSGSEAEVVVCGPFTTLPILRNGLEGSSIRYGAQNMHWEEAGAFTGEISASMLKDLGCNYVILGHSERRQLFGETDESVHQKVLAAIHAGITPIICVGESLDIRQAGECNNCVAKQVEAALHDLTQEAIDSVVIAYEPIWAIGTGETASPEQAQEVHAIIRKIVGDKTRIVYGGSVKPDSISALMKQPDIDGALVGGASLMVEDFLKIVNY